MKEGFNTKHASGVLLRKKRLERCGKDGQLLTHIKPSHVRNSSRTDVRSPEDLFAAARGAGFEVVVAVYRHNALARAVSSFEIHRYAGLKREDSGTLAARRREAKLRQRASEDFCHKPGALKRHFETERDLYDRGLRAARRSRPTRRTQHRATRRVRRSERGAGRSGGRHAAVHESCSQLQGSCKMMGVRPRGQRLERSVSTRQDPMPKC